MLGVTALTRVELRLEVAAVGRCAAHGRRLRAVLELDRVLTWRGCRSGRRRTWRWSSRALSSPPGTSTCTSTCTSTPHHDVLRADDHDQDDPPDDHDQGLADGWGIALTDPTHWQD